jgi:hypothetical protein
MQRWLLRVKWSLQGIHARIIASTFNASTNTTTNATTNVTTDATANATTTERMDPHHTL